MVLPKQIPELVAPNDEVALETKIKVVNDVLVQKMSYVDAGKANGVAVSSAFKWSEAQLKDPKFLQTLADRALAVSTTRETMKDLLRLRELSKSPYHRLADLKKTTELFSGVPIGNGKFKTLMAECKDYSFRRVVRVGYSPNEDAQLRLRHDFAAKYLEVLAAGKRVINLDESLVNQLNFSRKLWLKKGSRHVVLKKVVNPQVVLIAAVDSNGGVYMSFSQANTNAWTFQLFVEELVKVLELEDEHWKANTILLLDNATYHRSKVFVAYAKKENIPLLYASPVSPQLCPVERLFGWLKRGDLNPENHKTGKR